MGMQRSSFARGWQPDADAVNAPPDALLRMDNLTLDELGVLALRSGSSKVNGSALADLDVHSLFTGVLSGSRYRMAGAGNSVYANSSSIASSVNGSGDIQFGSHLGQILFARGTTRKKYDGTTVRNWGIAQTGGTPTIAAVAADKKVMATCDIAEAPAFTYEEDDGTGAAFATGVDGTGNGSILLNTDPATSRGSITKLFAAATDFTAYDAGTVGTDDDLLQVYVYISDPTALESFRIMVDVSAGDFTSDYYFYDFTTTGETSLTPTSNTGLPISTGLQATDGARVRGNLPAIGTALPRAGLRIDKPVSNAGWSRLLVRRGDMTRFGTSSTKDWKTVRAVRLVIQATAQNTVAIDDIRLINNSVAGRYKWVYVHVYNNGTYQAKSAPSALSAETQMQAQGATVTVPADASRDSQINETWLFRGGGVMDSFYRVAVKTSVSGTGSYTISDALSDIDAMTVNIKLETDNAAPPNTIIDIEGPYYDRTFVLTATALYPSRRLNPDSFASGQVVTIAGADETALWVKKALGGLYIGTTKDIYRLEGTGAELPDGTIDFTKTPLNIDHPPITDAVAQDGNLLIYLSADGWRGMSGAGSVSIVAETGLLYRGQTRHGVSPVNLTTGRFRAAIANGQLIALTPEGASTTSSGVVYRHAPARGGWYRHVYTRAFRCVYREPDGTLIASDTAGFVWQLDTGTQDAGSDIAVTLWTKVDDDGRPYNRKDPWDLSVRLDTGGATATVAVHFDASSSSATSLAAVRSGEGLASGAIETAGVFRHVQLRVTGSFSTFRWYDFTLNYRERPALAFYAEPKPQTPSLVRRRFSGLQVIIDTLGGNATITPMLDGTALTAFTVNTSDALARSLTFQNVIGRDLWAKVSKSDGFELYQVTPRIVEELPAVMQGLLPKSIAGTAGVKAISGLQLRLCTLGVARVITPYLDGAALSQTFTVTTDADEPDEYTAAFVGVQAAADVTFAVDGDIELYEWAPIISASQPIGVKTWDSGPIDLGTNELTWLRGLRLKVSAGADITATPYFDGIPFAAVTLPVGVNVNQPTVLTAWAGRYYKGRVPRLVLTSDEPFYPYWIQPIVRESGTVRVKKMPRLPVTLAGAAS